MSPSTRRAWIEISAALLSMPDITVALHPEGVDRNMSHVGRQPASTVALHPEGVDRNNSVLLIKIFLI